MLVPMAELAAGDVVVEATPAAVFEEVAVGPSSRAHLRALQRRRAACRGCT
jgi:hypothetical protein